MRLTMYTWERKEIIQYSMPRRKSASTTVFYHAPALEKGIDILELLASTPAPLNMSEISERVGRSKSEIFRVLRVLERRHYVERTADGDQYALSNRLFLLGMERPPVKGLLEISLPLMHRLADETAQSCHLVVPSDEFMVVIARVDPPSDLGIVVRVGHRRPLLSSTSGMLITAFQPEIIRNRWLDAYSTAAERKDRSRLIQKLGSIRSQGFADIPSTVVPGIVDLAAPVLPGPAAVAALAIPYMRRSGTPVTQERAIELLCSTATTISGKLRVG
jgi:DNA-binding IclR family transcriptional regulator